MIFYVNETQAIEGNMNNKYAHTQRKCKQLLNSNTKLLNEFSFNFNRYAFYKYICFVSVITFNTFSELHVCNECFSIPMLDF